jgi:hypothetical protein
MPQENIGENHNHAVIKFIMAPKAAIPVFIAEIIIILTGIFVKRDLWLPYYNQQFTVTPPILVISSDDWGGIDPIETPHTLDNLANILRTFQDSYGHHPVITVFLNPAAPDFERIVKSQYKEFFWRFCYDNKPDIVSKWQSLCNEGICEIQFHGREHFNMPLWLNLLQTNAPDFRKACQEKKILYKESVPSGVLVAKDPRFKYLARSFIDASVNPPRALRVEDAANIIKTGLGLIEKHFGVEATVMAAPGHIWDNSTCKAMSQCKISFLESSQQPITVVRQDLSLCSSNKFWSYTSNICGVRAVLRTSALEPTERQKGPKTAAEALPAVKKCLAMQMPVVIETHKQHYVEQDEKTAKNSLAELKAFIREIQKLSPDIAFLSSSDLAKYIHGIESIKQQIPFQMQKLTDIGKITHLLRCLWVVHAKFRIAVYLTIIGFIWSIGAIMLRQCYQN